MCRIWALFDTRTGRSSNGNVAEGSAASCVTPAWSGSTSCVAEAATPSTIGRNAAGKREHISRRFSSIFTSHRRRQKPLGHRCQYYPHTSVAIERVQKRLNTKELSSAHCAKECAKRGKERGWIEAASGPPRRAGDWWSAVTKVGEDDR